MLIKDQQLYKGRDRKQNWAEEEAELEGKSKTSVAHGSIMQ